MIARRRHQLLLAVSTAAIIAVAALAAPKPASSAPLVPPNADLSVSPNPALVNETVNFDGSGSTGDGLGGTITKYEWDLDGDGSFETDTGTDPTTSRSYDSPRTITVTLRVTDSEGDTDEDSVELRINAPPIAGFIFEPSEPLVGEEITFSSTSSDPDGSIPSGSYRWDFDADGQFDDATGESVTKSYSSPGTKQVSLEVTDSDGATAVASRAVPVRAHPPTASFTFSPDAPLSNELVIFDASGSSPPAGQTLGAMAWDLDGDGAFDDDFGEHASFTYATPGPHPVAVRVEASGGGSDIATGVVPVGNRPPIASFNFAPESPREGETVELTSLSSDPDSPIADQEWDLDGDGEYDDASGATAEQTFEEAGEFTVGLRVRDANGATAETSAAISVGSGTLELLSPFPVVRLAGELKPSGNTLIERLSVRAPQGTDVAVRCKGGSCPFGKKKRTIKRRQVDFPEVERPLRPGVVLKIYATDPEAIGKFTRFKLRNEKPPKRADKCLEGDSRNPIPCPRS